MRNERFLSSAWHRLLWMEMRFGKHLGSSQLEVLFCFSLSLLCAKKIRFFRWFWKGLELPKCDFKRALCVCYLIVPLMFIRSDNSPLVLPPYLCARCIPLLRLWILIHLLQSWRDAEPAEIPDVTAKFG